jgi:uncharacterized protein (TIGR00661 family)
MKILYSIQGTGNGHISRAASIYPYLIQYGEVDYLISGNNHSLQTPFEIKYRLSGVSFQYNHRGGIDYLATLRQLNMVKFLGEIDKLPVENYDLVINDFEPISARAAMRKSIPCIAMSHQASFLSAKTPLLSGSRDFLAINILKKFAPAHDRIGFHFDRYDDFIYTPVIKDLIRHATPVTRDHITVYLPSFSLFYIRNIFSTLTNIPFEIFHPEVSEAIRFKNITFLPVSQDGFNQSLISCSGVISNAGFEIPSEAFFLGKAMLLIPVRGQYEQACNAAAAERLGARVIYKAGENFRKQILEWIDSRRAVRLDFPFHYREFLDDCFEKADRIRSVLKVPVRY